MDQSVSNRRSRSMAPKKKQKGKEETDKKHKEKKKRKLSDEEKEDKRVYEKQRKISSNITTFLADIIRVKRKTKKKIAGYNQAEAFELYKILKTVFNEVDTCERQRLIQMTEDIQEKTENLKDAIKNLKNEREETTKNDMLQQEPGTDDEPQDLDMSIEHQTVTVKTSAELQTEELEELDKTYCNYMRMKGQPNWTTSNNHTTTDFHNIQETANQADAITDNFHVFHNINKHEVSKQPAANLFYRNKMSATVHQTADAEPVQLDYWTSGLWTSTGEV